VSAPLNLDAIRARADAATEGPWRAERHIDFPSEPGYLVYVAPADGSEFGTAGDVGWTDHQADAEFIANARTDIPDLLAEVTRLRAELVQAELDVASLCALRDQQEREGFARLARIKDIQDDRAALTAERDALAAVIEQVRAMAVHKVPPIFDDIPVVLTGEEVLAILATTPADALEAAKAEACAVERERCARIVEASVIRPPHAVQPRTYQGHVYAEYSLAQRIVATIRTTTESEKS
jgi:hypothetical protein